MSKIEKEDTLHFQVSSGLKDILGRELITDDEIAIFELVKNAYDAHAKRVDVIFENLFDKEHSRIIIKDDGKGMSLSDIENKWLFVAYSAKKEGTEDEDYRDKIYQHRAFAGAKGIGRFSCDRLGRKLRLYTSKEESQFVEIIDTDWEEFERNLRHQFVTIEIPHKSISKLESNLRHGTILEITELRSFWHDKKIERLYNSLAKLIHPGDKIKDFEIFLTCKDLGIVERGVENFIFEALEIKTSSIDVSISKNGETITTELLDGGTSIYKIQEKNTYSSLYDIHVKIFYLNKSAKLTFSHRMGVNTKDYGSIFLYKNNIRIYPFGESDEDTLGLDSRKAQKPTLYIGNKDVIGRIEINGDNKGFVETSSRGSGFIINDVYLLFKEFVWDKAIVRLEKYVIDVQKWGNGLFLSVEDNLNTNDKEIVNNRITTLVSKLTNNSDIIDIEYNENFLSIINDSQKDSVTSLIKNLFKMAKDTGNDKILSVANTTEKRVEELLFALEQSRIAEDKAKEALEEKESENLFLKSIKSQDHEEVVSLLHHAGISSKNIDNELKYAFKRYKKGDLNIDSELYSILEYILFENKKILSISRFASKANFKLYTEEIDLDVVEYIIEYIKNILGLVSNQKPNIIFTNDRRTKFNSRIKPLELNIVIDNLISNSRRASAENIYISFLIKEGSLFISFSDDGNGIKEEHIGNLFNFGFTTTVGSGIGLYHIKKMLNQSGNDILYNSDNKQLTEFIVKLN
ncbi:sensor histidine kinase [Pedobacter sp.]|uniref:sensor histidine kinase n=1 Tax=Pedobacter sp. TaxID=1411316 RepID=UPI0031D4CD89